MFRSYRIGSVFGFPIEVNLSFAAVLVLALVLNPGWTSLVLILAAFGSVLLHEIGHSLMARHLGVPVAGIELHFFGGAAKMGTPENEGDEIAIAAAGPAVSFALGGVFLGLGSVLGVAAFQYVGWINIVIGSFNLLPALPMDGGRIFRALLSRKVGFLEATNTATFVARGIAIAMGVLGLVYGQFFIAALAVVLWFMSSAEQMMAERAGGTGYYGYGGTRADVVPPGAEPWVRTRYGSVHRPVATGGFTVRPVNGRLVIEIID